MASNWSERRVVVTGLGAVTPLGHQVDTFWANLINGKGGVDKITRFDASKFDAQIAAEVKDFDPLPAFPSRQGITALGPFMHSSPCMRPGRPGAIRGWSLTG